jgi:hypothetical protein
MEQQEVAAATSAARNLGKHNRDIGQKIGAPAPFDAPEKDIYATSSSGVAVPAGQRPGGLGKRSGVPPAMPLADSHAEARAEMAANRTRMRGHQDLLGGYEFVGQQNRRTGSLPPKASPAQDLLPEAMMKLQYGGGNIRNLTCANAEYLNSKVLAEANRERNRAGVILG